VTDVNQIVNLRDAIIGEALRVHRFYPMGHPMRDELLTLAAEARQTPILQLWLSYPEFEREIIEAVQLVPCVNKEPI